MNHNDPRAYSRTIPPPWPLSLFWRIGCLHQKSRVAVEPAGLLHERIGLVAVSRVDRKSQKIGKASRMPNAVPTRLIVRRPTPSDSHPDNGMTNSSVIIASENRVQDGGALSPAVE